MSLLLVFLISILGILSGCASVSPDVRIKANNRVEVADAMIRGQNYPGALKELLTAESEDPKNAAVQDSLGRVYFAREKYELNRKLVSFIEIPQDLITNFKTTNNEVLQSL